MGINHFFPWFKHHFSKNIYRIKKGQDFSDIKVEIDTLMIDMNGIFHNSAQKIYQYGNYKPRQQPRFLGKNKIQPKPHGAKAQLMMFEDVCRSVDDIFKLVKPNKSLVLCVDGPAPIAKQNQQRRRRFRSALEQEDNSTFNSNCITPGTKFMDFLTKYMDWYIRKKISEDDDWKKVQVIFSNEKACGEGEAKLINYIRHFGCHADKYCIYGLDADLIMLALGTHKPNFYILRDDLYDVGNEFYCVNIGSTRHELANLLRWNEGKHAFSETSGINDFIFICFMVGNDFLPHIPSIEIIEGGIDLMIEIYKEVGISYGHLTRLVDDCVQLRTKQLGVFLGTIGQHEKENFEAKLFKKESFFPDPLLESCSTQVQGGKWNVDIEKYKEDYFNTSFPPGTVEEKLCHDYIEGMQWVLSYYTRGVPNWKWYFPYHYAPPASVIAQHTRTFTFPVYPRTISTTPFQQLLCVLPPKSANLIPQPLCRLLTDESSPLRKFCPDDFEIDLSGKRREWEGIVILPMVDFNLVRECYMNRIEQIDEREMKRNKLGRSFIYTYSPEFPIIFRSYYGDIEKCCVKSIPIDL